MTNLSATIVHDADKNKFTAFVNEFPGVVVQADTKEAVKSHLNIAWSNFLTYLHKSKGFAFKEEEFSK